MAKKLQRLTALALAPALAALCACGGGGTSSTVSSNPPPPPTPPATTSVAVKVIDDAIENATVCLDKNLNGRCDTDEPTGKTNATGSVTLTVLAADAGKYPVLAVVGTDATDARYGPITTPFTLQAPADQPSVVSPLTTLVQSVVASTGITSTAAAASVQAQTGITVSLFEDFTQAATPNNQAATIARLAVLVAQEQSTVLRAAVGTQAADNTLITQADLNKIIQNKLVEILPSLITALTDPAVLNAAPAALDAALRSQAASLATSPDTGVTLAAAATLVAINNQTATSAPLVAEASVAAASLRALSFTNIANWFVRINTSSAAQNTPDSMGNLRFVERRSNSVDSSIATWNTGQTPSRQADLHFNGSSWVACAINGENTTTVRDARGNAKYNFCDGLETGTTNRASFDVSGKAFASVLTDARTAGYTNLSVGDNTLTSLTALLGSDTFPTGSSLVYQSSTPLTQAVSYNPVASNVVNQYSSAVTRGGLNNAGCTSSEFQGLGAPATTLEGLIAANPGTPCLANSNSFMYAGTTYTSPDSPSEAWANSSIGISAAGPLPVGTGPAPGYYSGNTRLRIAFKGEGTNPVTYLACKERFNNGSPRNCTAIGTGSFTIASLGDARILTLSGEPAQVTAQSFSRVFVERGGKIYAGFKNRPVVGNAARLNLTATNALFSKLGLPNVDPEVPMTLTAASYAGAWELFDTADPTVSNIITIATSGATSCAEYNNAVLVESFACTLTFTDLTQGSFTLTDNAGNSGNSTTGTFNFLTGAASGTYVETSPPANGSFTGARR